MTRPSSLTSWGSRLLGVSRPPRGRRGGSRRRKRQAELWRWALSVVGLNVVCGLLLGAPFSYLVAGVILGCLATVLGQNLRRS